MHARPGSSALGGSSPTLWEHGGMQNLSAAVAGHAQVQMRA